ncbi:tuberoinfundibular peptide of 39 residues [Chiloscyllium punctatum]|uniref:tuberoinfundibular peptide of 39 residues n=1 Tax=Chiloscyllium punctatum TaxID=137246 RepID=UPI003B63B581
MEPPANCRALLLGLILSYVLAPCLGTVPPLLKHTQSSLSRSWKTGNLPAPRGVEQVENILQLLPGWDPSGPLHDWGIEMMSSVPTLKGLLRKNSGIWWIPVLRQPGRFPLYFKNHDGQPNTEPADSTGLTSITLGKSWSSDWLEPSTNEEVKRSFVVADDVAFREKSKLLTAMQRQKWLNAVMRQLVINKK